MREDGQPFSSFGLIWAHYGRHYLAAMDVPVDDIETIHTKFDTKFVLPIDLLDNGAMEPSVAGPLSILTLPALLGSLKPVFDDTRRQRRTTMHSLQHLPIAQQLYVEAQIRNLAANAQGAGHRDQGNCHSRNIAHTRASHGHALPHCARTGWRPTTFCS